MREGAVFAENSEHNGPCTHATLRYVVDCGYHTIGCDRCGARWTLMPTGVTPKYLDGDLIGLSNHTPPDSEYPLDECVSPHGLGGIVCRTVKLDRKRG